MVFKKVQKLIQKLQAASEDPYFFTIFFAVAILLFTIPYNLLLPAQFYCHNGFPANLYIYFTAPFNIGCEASLTNLGNEAALSAFMADYLMLVLYVCSVEYIFHKEEWKGRWKLFFSAALATYLTSALTLLVDKQLSAGTSIVAVSMNLTLLFWILWKATTLKGKNRLFLACGSIPLAVILTSSFFIGGNWGGHMIGGFIFVVLAGLYILGDSRFNSKPLRRGKKSGSRSPV